MNAKRRQATLPMWCPKRTVGMAFWIFWMGFASSLSAGEDLNREPITIEWVKGHYDGTRSILKLSAELKVPDGWHVYADSLEQEYYIPTRFAFPDSLKVGLVKKKYPKPEVKDILGETLPVFKGTVAFDNYFFVENGVPAEGLLQYQSCTDKMCLPPVFTKVGLQAGENGSVQIRY